MFTNYRLNYRTLQAGNWTLHFWEVNLPAALSIEQAIKNRHSESDMVEILNLKQRKLRNLDGENIHMSYYRNLGIVDRISDREETTGFGQTVSL